MPKGDPLERHGVEFLKGGVGGLTLISYLANSLLHHKVDACQKWWKATAEFVLEPSFRGGGEKAPITPTCVRSLNSVAFSCSTSSSVSLLCSSTCPTRCLNWTASASYLFPSPNTTSYFLLSISSFPSTPCSVCIRVVTSEESVFSRRWVSENQIIFLLYLIYEINPQILLMSSGISEELHYFSFTLSLIISRDNCWNRFDGDHWPVRDCDSSSLVFSSPAISFLSVSHSFSDSAAFVSSFFLSCCSLSSASRSLFASCCTRSDCVSAEKQDKKNEALENVIVRTFEDNRNIYGWGVLFSGGEIVFIEKCSTSLKLSTPWI